MESQFFKPPWETEIGSKNQEFKISKVAFGFEKLGFHCTCNCIIIIIIIIICTVYENKFKGTADKELKRIIMIIVVMQQLKELQ